MNELYVLENHFVIMLVDYILDVARVWPKNNADSY